MATIIDEPLIPEQVLAGDAPVNVEKPAQSDMEKILADEAEEFFDFTKQQHKLRRLVDDWSSEIKRTEERRLTRDVEVNVNDLRASGRLDEDETLIPDRVIDTNIRREQPPYVNYLKNSRRIAIFECLSNPDTNTQRLELEFTRGMTYIGWEVPHFKTLDGTQTHGWDIVEVVYDITKPLHVGLEQVGHDRLLFPRSAIDIQTAPKVIRRYDVSLLTLKSFVRDFGFDGDQVSKIINKIKDTQKEVETVEIYKEFCKYDGKVYVAWFSLSDGVSDWLKKPVPLFLGIRHKEKKQIMESVTIYDPNTMIPSVQQVPREIEEWVDTPITQYPIFVQVYQETEKPKVTDHKGRVFLDENKQEAQTAIISGYVNGLTRASSVYASRGTDDGSGDSLREEQDIRLVGGRILDKPVNFFHPDYPDPSTIKAMQYLDTANDQEVGQPNFTAINRQDSRKTAKEITAAQSEQALLNSVQLTLFSAHIRAIYNFVWLIVQSLALQDEISFLLVEQTIPVMNPIDQSPLADGSTQKIWVNDYTTISQIYDIRAAGDVDVIQKQEKVMQMKQDWPIISQTPLALPFLAEMMRLQYPDTGEKWAQALLQQTPQIDAMRNMLKALGDIIMGVMQDNPEIANNLPPEQAVGLQQIMQQVASITQPQQQAQGKPNA